MGVAERDHRPLGHDDRGVRALEPRHHRLDRVLDRAGLLHGEEGGHDLRVRGAAEPQASLAQVVVELDRVGQIAVVGERDLPTVVAPHGLAVLPRATAGGGVADVADRHVAGEGLELLLVEDLGDQPRLAEGCDVATLAAGDSRGLLTAVLEGVEGEVGEPGDVVPRRVHAKHPALVTRAVAVWDRAIAGVHPRCLERRFRRQIRLPRKASSGAGSPKAGEARRR